MNFLAKAAALAALAVLPQAAIAKGISYECQIPQTRGQLGWIPEVLFIARLDGAKSVTVSDPLVLHYNGEPVAGKVAVDNSRRVTFAWDLDFQNRGQSGTMSYRATYVKGNKVLTISARPLGYSNNINGKGTCVLKQLK